MGRLHEIGLLKVALIAAVGLLFILAGCVSITKSTRTFAIEKPSPGRAMLYVYRVKDLTAANQAFSVELDGKNVGYLKMGAYLVQEVAPGKHSVAMNKTEELHSSGGVSGAVAASASQSLEIELADGGACFVRIQGTSFQNYGSCGAVPADIKDMKFDREDGSTPFGL